MLAFLIALLFGIGETLLLALLYNAVAGGNKALAKKLLWLKIGTYCIAAGLFVFAFLSFYLYIIAGLAVGIPIAALGLLFYNVLFRKGDE